MAALLVLLALVLSGCTGAKPPREGKAGTEIRKIVLTGATLIDGTDRAPIANATVVIERGRIQTVQAQAGEVAAEPGVKIIRLNGKFLLPGLFDSHVHYLGWAAPLYLAGGITSVADAGNWTAWILAQRWAVATGLVPGPRIFTAGGQLDSPPGTYPHSINVATEESAREAVRQHVRRGVDFIKVYTMLQMPMIKAIVEEAHAAGLPVRGHITVSAREAAQAGLDSLEHISGVAIATMENAEKLKEIERRRGDPAFLPTTVTDLAFYMRPERFDDLIGVLIQQKTFLDPTLVSWWMGVHPHTREYEAEDRAALANPALSFIPDLSRGGIVNRYARNIHDRSDPKFKTGFANVQKFVKSFVAAGGKVVAGSDTTLLSMPGADLHREMELLVEAGLTPLQVLQAATRNAADLMRKGKDLGTVEAGKLADLIVLGADPLKDIRNTRKVEMVIKDGKIQDIEMNPQFMDALPRPITKEYLRMLNVDEKGASR